MVPTQTVLEIETQDVRPFARLLRGIGFQQRAVVTLSTAGLAFQVEDTRAMVAVAYVSQALFDTFKFVPSKMIPKPKRQRVRNPEMNQNPFIDGPSTPSRRSPDIPDDSSSDEEEHEEDDPASFQFEVNLSTLIECLNIYGHANVVNPGQSDDSLGGTGRTGKRYGGDEGERGGNLFGGTNPNGSTAILMKWAGPGWPLELILNDSEPNTPVTACELTLLEPEMLEEDQFDQEHMLFHVIMKANWLRDAIGDLDASCVKLTITAGPPLPEEQRLYEEQRDNEGTNRSREGRKARERAGIFRLQAKGDFGMTELDFPNDKDVMDVFICSEKMTFSYSFGLFCQANRALQAAMKISLRIDDQGYLSLQMMMPTPAGKRLVGSDCGIIEFKLRALEGED